LIRHERKLRGRSRAGRWARSGLTVAVVAILTSGCGYSEINELEEQVRGAWYEIEVQLQRRAELVPGLVEAVRDHGAVGEEALAVVSDARARLFAAVRSGDVVQMESANAELCDRLEQMLGRVAGMTELQSDPGFQLLRSQLQETEQQLVAAGQTYNDAARRYNDLISRFPQLVTAKVIGAERVDTFQIDGDSVVTPSADE
jgi:LemA protein